MVVRYKRRTKKKITYHGRTGNPMIHQTKAGRPYIMVRAEGGGTKRLYQGSRYRTNRQTKGTKDRFATLHI